MVSVKKPSAFVAVLLWTSLLASPLFAAAQQKKLRLAYSGWGVGATVSYVGIDGGIFSKYGLEVEEVFIRDALTGGVQSLLGVDLVLGFGSPFPILSPILGGADIVFAGSHVSTEQYGMGVTDDINSLKELKGKKIGVSALGARSDLVARVILRRAGLDPVGDVQMVAAGFSPDRMAALSKNLIQGAPLNPEFVAQAKRQGIKVLEVRSVPVIESLLMTTRSMIKKDGEAIRRFMKGYTAAIHFYLTRKNESLAIIKKYFTGTDPSSLESMYYAYASQLKPLPVINTEALQAMVDAVAVADPRARKLKPSDLFDSRFLDELKESGFVEELYSEKVSL